MIILVLRRYGHWAALALLALDVLIGSWLLSWKIRFVKGMDW